MSHGSLAANHRDFYFTKLVSERKDPSPSGSERDFFIHGSQDEEG